jgi:hypothetical protein
MDEAHGLTWSRALARSAEVLRSEGVRSLALKALGKTVFRKVVLIELDLEQLETDLSTDVPLRTSFLRPEDVPEYLRFRPDCGEEEVRERLAHGDICFVAWNDGRIASASWFQFGKAQIPGLDRQIPLEERQVYDYDSWTASDLRGHNIATVRDKEAFLKLRDAGYRSVLGYVLPENRSGFGPPAKLGFRKIGSAGFVRLGPVRLDFIRHHEHHAEWKVRRSHERGILAGAKPI